MTTSYSAPLSTLLQDITPIQNYLDRVVTGITQDSRSVQAGDLFCARRGLQSDGTKFIAEAIAKGAAAVLVEADDDLTDLLSVTEARPSIPIVGIKNLAQYLGIIAGRFYGNPSQHLKVIGITGTNGKTSCTYFLAQALQVGGELCGLIGTLGSGYYDQLQPGSLTTPDVITVHRLIAEFRAAGAKYVAMEVSSHSLVQGRITGVNFYLGAFTNLTRDHLDYHGDIDHYAQAKRMMFSQPGLQYGVLNADDAYGQEWLRELNGHLPVMAYSLNARLEEKAHDLFSKIVVHHAQFDQNGITASIHTPWGDGVLHNPYLIGRFNLSNLLAVVSILGILGIPLESILQRLTQLRNVPGRMETFGGGGKPLIVVDFAHTPDALENVLEALKAYKQGKLWCVFGCGGDRDRGKRAIMGSIVERYADQLIITDDNPRHEDPKQIVSDILQGIQSPVHAVIEHDRRRAIAHAVSCAQPDDIILIAGKGHETYQLVGDEKEPFNDALEVQKLLALD